MTSIKKWLEVNGYMFREVIMTGGTKGIMVDTNYDGLYATAETLRMHHDIFNKVKRFKGLECESRGCFLAVLITEKAESVISA